MYQNINQTIVRNEAYVQCSMAATKPLLELAVMIRVVIVHHFKQCSLYVRADWQVA